MDQPGTHMQKPKSLHPNDLAPQKQLTDAETRVLRECQKESTMYRAFPLSTFAGISTYFGIKNMGILKPHATYGAVPKVVVACTIGYIIGKMSYFSQCQSKILRDIPHSNLAAAVRRSRGMPPIDNPEGDGSHAATMDYSGSAFMPLNIQEGDSQEEEAEQPLPNSIRSYDDRRMLNRKMYEAHKYMSPPQPVRPSSMDPLPPPPPPPAVSPPRAGTNKYGDEGFE